MIRFISWLIACLAVALFAAPARAEPSETDRATARELATAGYHALKRGDFAIAADHFQRADALVHAPTLVVDWGRALAGLGLLVEAVEKYQLVIVEGVAPGSPSSWQNAHAEARVELEALRPRLAWLTLVVSGAEKPAITVDRIRLPDAALGVPRAMNPGKHEIRVRAASHLPEVRSVSLSEGSKERVEIALVPPPRDTDGATPHDADAATPRDAPATRSHDSPMAKPQASPKPPAAPPKSGDTGTRRALVYAAFATGGAGLVVGGVTGAMALHRRSELQSQCSGGVCPASESDEIDAYQRLGVASGIGFGIAALGIGTGITLLLTESDESPSDDGPKRSRGLSPFVGLGTIGVTGRY